MWSVKVIRRVIIRFECAVYGYFGFVFAEKQRCRRATASSNRNRKVFLRFSSSTSTYTFTYYFSSNQLILRATRLVDGITLFTISTVVHISTSAEVNRCIDSNYDIILWKKPINEQNAIHFINNNYCVNYRRGKKASHDFDCNEAEAINVLMIPCIIFGE